MEFLRFGSRIPGAYWGCCAMDIIQDFKQDPEQEASIQMVSGDGGTPCNGRMIFAGPTYKDIFLARIRVGTFDVRDMPNHGFLAILTRDQIRGSIGRKWLAILKETGFEFIRTVSNSVYDGQGLGKPVACGNHPNYLFGLFRNVGSGGVLNPFLPPSEWTDLPQVVPEAWQALTDTQELANEQHSVHKKIWNKIGPAKFLSEEEVVAKGAPVILAGKITKYQQQEKAVRVRLEEEDAPKTQAVKVDPFAPAAPVATPGDVIVASTGGW